MTTTTSEPKSADKPAAPAPAPAPAPPSDQVTLTIDGQKVTVKKGTLVVEAAKKLDQSIPVFCYHPNLKPVGACRMCLVEIEKMPRLQTACTTPVAEGMVVKTRSEMATNGQNGVVTLLLANHPLDCPVCDKGGECPLQDNAFGHGVGTSRFEEEKRHKDKAFELSDKIVLDRERCILCYRCVRFHEEVPGDRNLAVIERGSKGEIGLAVGEQYTSPMQGNVVDICPVGALTSRQYRFRSRPWDLRKSKGIAKDDPVGSNLWIDSRDGRVLRLRPREHAELNDAWLADRTRFDTVPVERTVRPGAPLVRQGKDFVATTWFEGLRKAGATMRNHTTGVLAATTLTNEALCLLKDHLTTRVSVFPRLSSWAPRGRLASLSTSKSVVVVGFDPYVDAPILAMHIRKAIVPFASGGQSSGGGGTLVVVGAENGLFRDTKAWLKTTPENTIKGLQDLVAALGGKGSPEAQTAASFLKERPASIVAGPLVANDPEGRAALEQLRALLGCTDETSFCGAVDGSGNAGGARRLLGERALVEATAKEGVLSQPLDTLLILGDAPVAPTFPITDAAGARVVWATAHAPIDGAGVPDFVDVILPLADLYEQAGSFTNIEGRVQGFDAGGIPPGKGNEKAKADWELLGLLLAELGVHVPKDLKTLRAHFAVEGLAALPLNKTTLPTSLNVM